MIYILIGPSGSGKTVIGNNTELTELKSHTTRSKREGESEGDPYYFITEEEFFELDKVEETEYDGNYYCLSRKEVNQKLEENEDVFVIMDREGIEQMLERYDEEKIKVIYITATKYEIIKRLLKRDGFIKMVKRIYHALKTGEFNNSDIADLVINNKDGSLNKSIERVKSFVRLNEKGRYKFD